jgi:hypothetical protein
MNTETKTTPPKVNRRASRRLASSNSARIECRKGTLGLGPNLTVSFLDISETGVRLVLKSLLDKGQAVELLLQAGSFRPIKRLATVQWSLSLDNGAHCTGLNFERTIPFADVQRLARAMG